MRKKDTGVDDTLKNSEDFSIIREVVGGNTEAFERLLLKYQRYVFKIVSKHIPLELIEETAHEVFIRTFRSLNTFGYKSDFKHWLSIIAVRACYDYWRKSYRSREISMTNLLPEHREWLREVMESDSIASFSEKGKRQEAGEVLDWALNQLGAADRIIIELVYLEGMSGKEVSDLLGWSTANIKIRSFRAKKKLHRLLKKETLNY